MQTLKTDQMIFTDLRHMPIVKAYANKIGLIDTVDKMVDSQMELSPRSCRVGYGTRYAIRQITPVPSERIL
jgi:hypothetical protein